jgi:hypothetical protein
MSTIYHVVFLFNPHPGLGSYLAEALGGPAGEPGNLKVVYLPGYGLQVTVVVRLVDDACTAVVTATDMLRMELRAIGIALPEATYSFGSRLRLGQIHAHAHVEAEGS